MVQPGYNPIHGQCHCDPRKVTSKDFLFKIQLVVSISMPGLFLEIWSCLRDIDHQTFLVREDISKVVRLVLATADIHG